MATVSAWAPAITTFPPARPIITTPAGTIPTATGIAAACSTAGDRRDNIECPVNRRDEMRPCLGQCKTARRKGVTIEKVSGQCKGIGKRGGGRRLGLIMQKGGQRQELLAIGFACSARHRAT